MQHNTFHAQHVGPIYILGELVGKEKVRQRDRIAQALKGGIHEAGVAEVVQSAQSRARYLTLHVFESLAIRHAHQS